MQTFLTMFDRFDRIRIISLPYRADRRREMAAELRKVGLDGDPRVRFFDAARPDSAEPFGSIGAHGCFRSHLEILRQSEGDSVLILEDDCDFSNDAADYDLPDDCDIFYGGYLDATDPDDIAKGGIVGSHCMGFSKRAVPVAVRYLESFFGEDFVTDPEASRDPGYDPAIRPPIDGAYVWLRRAHPELKVVFADPRIAFQRPSRTDIGPRPWFDRVAGLRHLAEGFRQARRRALG